MARKRKRDAPLSVKEIEHYKTLLLDKRMEILGNVVSMENDTLRKESTELSRIPLHLGDAGSDTCEMDNTLNLVDSERRLLLEIDRALDRIERGTYGICLGSGEPIGRARLEAIPWARYTVTFATLVEQGLAEEPEPEGTSDESAA